MEAGPWSLSHCRTSLSCVVHWLFLPKTWKCAGKKRLSLWPSPSRGQLQENEKSDQCNEDSRTKFCLLGGCQQCSYTDWQCMLLACVNQEFIHSPFKTLPAMTEPHHFQKRGSRKETKNRNKIDIASITWFFFVNFLGFNLENIAKSWLLTAMYDFLKRVSKFCPPWQNPWDERTERKNKFVVELHVFARPGTVFCQDSNGYTGVSSHLSTGMSYVFGIRRSSLITSYC